MYHPGVARTQNLETELKHVLTSAAWKDASWVYSLDMLRARDADVADGILDEHLACVHVARNEWDRLEWLRASLTPVRPPRSRDTTR